MIDMVKRIWVLTELECQKVDSVVRHLDNFWIQRHQLAPFYTLGAASYIDAAQDQTSYYTKAMLYNTVLYDALTWLYEKLIVTLEQHLHVPVIYLDWAALPGFHIYLDSKLFELPAFVSTHFDCQYQYLIWEDREDIAAMQMLSFTLPISLPSSGAGLNTWDISGEDAMKLSKEELGRLTQSALKTFHPYYLGQLILHSGHLVHQATLGDEIQPGDSRVTLQGHAVLRQKSWNLYW
jgi:hypothetical protein